MPLQLKPGQLFFSLDNGRRRRHVEGVVKGHCVKVHYKAASESEKKNERDAVAQVIVQSMKRIKK